MKDGLRKGRGIRHQISNIHWIIEKMREFQGEKKSTSASLTIPKPLTVWITINCGKFLKQMGISDHFTCLLRNLYASQEVTIRLDMEQWTVSKLGKEYIKAIHCHPVFNLYAVYIMQNAKMVNHKLESRLPGKTSTTSDMQMISLQWQKAERNYRAS